jgi:carbon monoxide dehydrogenase subunit G
MELTNAFRVGVGLDKAWEVLTDVERIAPLLPGAHLLEVEGDQSRGVVKVKVGPIQAQYRGTASFLERDRQAGRVVLEASGRDTRGQGHATATVTATLSGDDDATDVSVVTDLTITGKVAQFGRGVLADVSGKLVTQFVDALEADLASAPPDGPAAPSAADTAAAEPLVGDTPVESPVAAAVPAGLEAVLADGPVGPGTTALLPGTAPRPPAAAVQVPRVPLGRTADGPGSADAQGSGTAPEATAPPTVRRIDSAEAEPVDLLDVAGGSLARRLGPVVGVAAAVVLVLLARRRSRR